MATDTPVAPEPEGEDKKGKKKRERKPKTPKESKPRRPGREARWLLPTVGLAVSILVGLVVAIFGNKGEIELRPIGATLPALVGTCCSTSSAIYGIVGLIACVLLWGVVFFR